MGKQRSFRSKAVNLVSDLTTVLLNPISDKISKNPPSPPENNDIDSEESQLVSICEEGSVTSVDGPDTSSFTAFLYSLLKDDYFSAERDDGQQNNINAPAEPENVSVVRESGGKRGLISKGRQSIGKAMNYAARLAWFRNQASERMPKSEAITDGNDVSRDGGNIRPMESVAELPDMSDKSLLLSQKNRIILYASLPSLVKGRKWVLLYSTWKHGISLSTLYRKSMLCTGLSLLVVGDRGGAVFGGLVEAPLKPSKSRRYQGSNSTFLFTDVPGQPIIYRSTGVNRYYTVCSPDFLAMGGGCHFALYLDSDLLNGSSAASDTYGNSCLALSEDFVVKEVELWGFVNASRYEEILALSQNELPGICRW
uniref:Oxidation resistance protein 1 n=1 Tax=Chenopodium quinoa TaxID=63459 RepID=A0A803KXN2_CHEQI